ncbi:MAG: pteridine reductase [Dokdonella sp.]
MSSNANPVALVSGAGRRIGATITRTLHGAGYDIAAHANRSRGELASLLAELESIRPASTLAVHADLADLSAPDLLVSATLACFGRLDALVNNASVFFPTPMGTIDSDQWDALFNVNARAPLLLAQAAAPALREARGAIVNLVDIYSERPLPDHPVYVMSKAALVAMTQALAIDLAPNIRVNAVAPGAILWPQDGSSTERRDDIIARTPLARAGNAEEIANTVLWLLRDAGFITGQIIRVDGGRSLPV